MQNIDQQIEKLQQQKTQIQTIKDKIAGSWLESLCNDHSNLIHLNSSYGSNGHISFKADSVLINEIKKHVSDNVMIAKYSGFWLYTCLPDISEQIEKVKIKDNQASFRCKDEACIEISVSGYNVNMYFVVNDFLFKVSVDYSHKIHAENYSTMAKGNKIPHLVENSGYTKDGLHGSKYKGKNMAINTNNYSFYSYDSINFALLNVL